MKKSLKAWWNTPWTNGTYCKWSITCVILSFIFTGIAIRKINRDFGIEKKEPKFKVRKNTNSLFDEVQNKDFRL